MNYYPKIRIHTWGGLGSQLLGIALGIDIQHRFPHRSIQICHHTSGVTERTWELDSDKLGFDFKVYPDFNQNKQIGQNKNRIIFLNKMLKYIAQLLRFHSSSNTNHEFGKLKPWVISVRGHYSHRTLTFRSLGIIANLLGLASQSNLAKDSEKVSVHYRLGDLVNVENKTFISPKTIIQVISDIAMVHNIELIQIYSDSPQIVHGLVGKQLSDFGVEILCRPSVETICDLVGSDVFIGSNSKISIWVAMFRELLAGEKLSYLPRQLQDTFVYQNPSYADNKVIFYD